MRLGDSHAHLIDPRELGEDRPGKLSRETLHQILGRPSNRRPRQTRQSREVQRIFQRVARNRRLQVQVHGQVDQKHPFGVLLAHVRPVLTAARQTPQLQPTVH